MCSWRTEMERSARSRHVPLPYSADPVTITAIFPAQSSGPAGPGDAAEKALTPHILKASC